MATGVLDAVGRVLAEARQPLHYQEITRRVLTRRLWTTEGKTPEATINARLADDIKRLGTGSLFARVSPGIYALRQVERGHAELDRDVHPESHHPSSADPDPGPEAEAEVSRLSFTDAAERVLNELGGKRPMHYRAITEQALASGLIQTHGRTPEATLIAQLGAEIDRSTRRGQMPRFVRHGRGLFGLTRWQPRGLAAEIEHHNEQVRDQLHKRLHAMPPAEFEGLVGDVLGAIGFVEVAVTGRSGDGGVDVRGTLVVGDVIQTRMAVQVKRWKNNVQPSTVREVRGGLGTHEQGLIITTSGFSKKAYEEAKRRDAVPVALMNGRQFVTLLVEHDLGVRRAPHFLLELHATDLDADGERAEPV